MTEPTRPASTTPWLQADGVPERLLQVLEALGAGVSIKAMDSGLYVQVSGSLDRLFERSESSVVGSSDTELMRPDEAQAMRRVELQAMQQGMVLTTEHRLDLGGRRREFSVSRVPLSGQHLLSVWTERTQERQREVHLQRALAQIEQHQQENENLRRELQKGSGRDETTGLQQLGLFNELLEREIDLSTREHREFSLGWWRWTCPRAWPRRPSRSSACSRPWAGSCARTRGRWTPPAGSTPTISRSCSPRWPGHRACAHGAAAPPVRAANRCL